MGVSVSCFLILHLWETSLIYEFMTIYIRTIPNLYLPLELPICTFSSLLRCLDISDSMWPKHCYGWCPKLTSLGFPAQAVNVPCICPSSHPSRTLSFTPQIQAVQGPLDAIFCTSPVCPPQLIHPFHPPSCHLPSRHLNPSNRLLTHLPDSRLGLPLSPSLRRQNDEAANLIM